jgi:hypothetical protein
MMQRHSILAGKCYRDRLGAIYRVVGFDGNGVQCILYHRRDQGGFDEREHSQSWSDFLEDLQGRSNVPLPEVGKSTHHPSGSSRQFTRLVDEAPTGGGWVHEIKYNGYRMHRRILPIPVFSIPGLRDLAISLGLSRSQTRKPVALGPRQTHESACGYPRPRFQ